MNTFVSQVGSAGLIGGCIGGIFYGTVGYFISTDTTEKYQRRILVGIIASAALAGLVMAIANSGNNAAVKSSIAMGAVYGYVGFSTEFNSSDDPYNYHGILGIVQKTLLFIVVGAASGYYIGKANSYMLS